VSLSHELSSFETDSRPNAYILILAWTTKPIKQDVIYEDVQGVKDALGQLQNLPPLVTVREVYQSQKYFSCRPASDTISDQ
jgi:hypothetical protein